MQDFVLSRTHDLRDNVKARFLRQVEPNDDLRNENKELRAMLAMLGSPQAPSAQVGTVTPMRVCSKSKPKFWNATTKKWDG